MSSSEYTDAILLLGDSLTETNAAGSLAQRMAEIYQRRADVLNRGFSGYTTEWIIPVIQQVFPASGPKQRVKLMTLWLGANDACLPGELQHVPLDRYKSNLSRLIFHVRSQSPETKIVVINPPPVIVDLWHRTLRQNFPSAHIPNRDAEVSKKYSDACNQVASEEGLPLADVYAAIASAAGGLDENKLKTYFSDGLHLTAQGYQVVFETVRETIVSAFPELDPCNMAMRMPAFNATPNGPF